MAPKDWDRARSVASETGTPIETALARLGLVDEPRLAEALSSAYNIPIISPSGIPPTPILENLLGATFLETNRVLPLDDSEERLLVGMVSPGDTDTQEAIRFAVEKPVVVGVMSPSLFEKAFGSLYGRPDNGQEEGDRADGSSTDLGEDDLVRLQDSASDAPVIRWVNQLISDAVGKRASDIHVEPGEAGMHVRIRIDGVLQDAGMVPEGRGAAVVSRIKVMARLNIAERRAAQDGRIRLAVRGKDVDIRVSTTPTVRGEGVVLRILDRGAVDLDLEALGFEGDTLERLRDLLVRPNGILLATGPTGSGKTTTLYAALRTLNTPDRKILTVEDPVEYNLPGISQVQVKPQIGLDFASVLRSFLRQDPDIMMVGEIRDLETAQVAVQASLTGHLILSTLHTNDAAGAITRLRDMGVEEFLLTSTLVGVIAQRLVRRLCTDCREEYEPSPDLLARLGLGTDRGPLRFCRPVGCPSCSDTGYHGRLSIAELLVVDDTIRELVIKKESTAAIEKAAIAAGMRPLFRDGLRKVLAGDTSIEEVLRVSGDI